MKIIRLDTDLFCLLLDRRITSYGSESKAALINREQYNDLLAVLSTLADEDNYAHYMLHYETRGDWVIDGHWNDDGTINTYVKLSHYFLVIAVKDAKNNKKFQDYYNMVKEASEAPLLLWRDRKILNDYYIYIVENGNLKGAF